MLKFEVMGDKQIARGFSRFTDGVKDLSAAFKEILVDFRKGEQRQFDTRGGYGAGGWAPLAEATIQRKDDDRQLIRTAILMESLTGSNPYAIADVKPLELRVGTKVPYAALHQTGTRNMPSRPVIMLADEQKTRWTKIIQRGLVEAATKAGLR